MSDEPAIAWSELDFAGFARLAQDPRLSKYEKIGFPDAYRLGHETSIFSDICDKLPKISKRGMHVVDIGPGCSDLPKMIIDLCETNGHVLHLIDSAEMLALLPERSFIHRHPGSFPACSRTLSHFVGTIDIAICYSVFHYVFVEADVFAFVDTIREWLAPGGACLIGDIPNQSKRDRFFASDAGKAFHRAFTGTDTEPPRHVAFESLRSKIDDTVVMALVSRSRASGLDAYVLPQPPHLPMANRREDILLRRP